MNHMELLLAVAKISLMCNIKINVNHENQSNRSSIRKSKLGKCRKSLNWGKYINPINLPKGFCYQVDIS